MMKKSFNVLPAGVIKGGTVLYAFDPVKENISYDVKIKARWGFFTKNIDIVGDYKIDPEQMKSDNFEIGKKLEIELLNLEVTKIKGDVAHANISLDGQDINGILLFDISGEYVQPISIDASGTVSGFSVRLILE